MSHAPRSSQLAASIATALLVFSASASAQERAIAIRGGTVLPISGPAIPNGTVVIRGGKIVAVGANVTVPVCTIVLRKAYGLGAQAMAGGGLHEPLLTVAWPGAQKV